MLRIKYDDKGHVASIIMSVPGGMANSSAEWVASEAGMLYADVAMLAEHHNNALLAEKQAWAEVAELEDYARAEERLAGQWEEKYHIALLETAITLNLNGGATYIEFTTSTVGEDLGIRQRREVETPKGIRAFTSADVARWLYNEGWRWQEGEFYDTPVPPSADDDWPF